MTLVEQVARAMCGKDVEWRDCATPCMQAGHCASDGYEAFVRDARAIIPIVLEAAAKVAEQAANERSAHPEYNMGCWDAAAAIRALGEQP